MKKIGLKFFILCTVFLNNSYGSDTHHKIAWDFQENNNNSVQVVSSHSNLEIKPTDAEQVLHLKTDDSASTNTIHISLSDKNIVAFPPHSSWFFPSGRPLTYGNEAKSVNLHCDVINHPDNFTAKQVFFDIHNAGYVHASDHLVYEKSTLGFKPEAAVNLMGAVRPEKNFLQSFPIVNIFSDLSENHKSLQQTQALCPSSLSPDCAISKLVIKPWNNKETNAVIDGSINFVGNFSIDLYLKGASISLFANKEF